MEEKDNVVTHESGQFLTFKLGEEVYGVDIRKIREVLEYTKVTSVPKTPEFMKGVINLRGGVVPVVDLRLKFGMEEKEKTVNTCIIIVEVTIDNDEILLGAIADSVREVVNLSSDQMEDTPSIGMSIRVDFIKSMGKLDDEFCMILDIDKIFSAVEMEAIKQSSDVADTEATG